MGKGKGKTNAQKAGRAVTMGDLTSNLGFGHPGWKVKCRTDAKFCYEYLYIIRYVSKRWHYVDQDIVKNFGWGNVRELDQNDKWDISEQCAHFQHNVREMTKCLFARPLYIMLWKHNGPYSAHPKFTPLHPHKRAANLGTRESDSLGVWIAVSVILCVILAAIGSYFCLFHESKKEKGGGLSKRSSKANKSSKLAGKSRISSRKSVKKSAKASLGSKSKASQRSKGVKSRRSKSSAKKK